MRTENEAILQHFTTNVKKKKIHAIPFHKMNMFTCTPENWSLWENVI